MKKFRKSLSILLVILLCVTTVMPGIQAVETEATQYVVSICDSDGNPIGSKMTMEESTTKELTALSGYGVFPNGSYIVWESGNPLIASINSEGKIVAHDSSKLALVQLWIDRDIKSIKGAGTKIGAECEKIIADKNIEKDSYTTIFSYVEGCFEILPDSKVEELRESLRVLLTKGTVDITAVLYSYKDEELARSSVALTVTPSTQAFSDYIPNGTFITNKDSLPKTVAVGTRYKLESVITPVRLKMSTNWSISAESIWSNTNDIAVIEDGYITFLKPGNITVTASPELELFLTKLIDYIYNAGDDGIDYISRLLIELLGIDVSASTLSTVLNALVKIVFKVVGIDSWISGISTGNKIVKTLANYLMKAESNDSISFEIVKASDLPLQSFEIGCSDEYYEGDAEQFFIKDMLPAGAYVKDIKWSVSDEKIASITEDGMFNALDAGENGGVKTVTVTADLDGMKVSRDIKIIGKDGSATTLFINGKSHIDPGESYKYTATVYPERAGQDVTWGIYTVTNGDMFVTSSTIGNDIIEISHDGTVTGKQRGVAKIVAKTPNGIKQYFTVNVGAPVSGVGIVDAPAKTYKVPVYNTYNETKKTLSAVVYPDTAANTNVKWSLSESQNLELKPDGTVSPIENKYAYGKVTVTTEDGGFKDTIYVAFANTPVTSVKLNKSSADLKAGEFIKLEPSFEPTPTIGLGGATIKDVFYVSSNPDIAVADSDGTVTALEKGSAVITCYSRDGLKNASCTVNVVANKENLASIISLAESLDLNSVYGTDEDIEFFENSLKEAKVVIADDTVYQFTVDAATDNLIDAYERLSDYIMADSIEITKDGSVTGDFITVSVKLLESYTSASLQLGYVINPDNAMVKSVVWSSDNSDIPVDQNGRLAPTVDDPCSTKITVTATDYKGNETTDSVYVAFVYQEVTDVKFNKNEINALCGETGSIEATVEPTGVLGINPASVNTLIWESSDESVVIVDKKGNLSYVGIGTAVVKATSVDGGKTATCTVNVALNKTKLKAIIDKSEACGGIDKYIDETYEVFAKELENAKAVYNKADATQEEIDASTSVMTAAYNQLIIVVNISSVALKYNDKDAGEYISKFVPDGMNYKDSSIQLSIDLLPVDTMVSKVEYFSDKSDISVDENGLCKPTVNDACFGEITVKVTDIKGRTATDKVRVSFITRKVFEVTVTPGVFAAESVNEEGIQLKSTSYYDSNTLASLQEVEWSSSNPAVVTVDENGKLSYHNSGMALIYATSVDGGVQGVSRIVVAGDRNALNAAIKAYDDKGYVKTDYSYETYTKLLNAYTNAIKVRDDFEMSQEQINEATKNLVDAMNGLEPFINIDKVEITRGDNPAPFHNSVEVGLSKSYKDASLTLGYKIYPENAVYKSVQWVSSSSRIPVNGSGKVSPSENKGGYTAVTLIVTDYYDREYKTSVLVSFANYPVTGVSLNKSELNLTIGATASLSETVSPTGTLGVGDATIKDVYWTSDNEKVATVSGGKVTAVEAGVAVITCTSFDTGKSAQCIVRVSFDKSGLLAVINQAKAFDEELYTPESYSVMMSVAQRAEEIYNSFDSTTKEVDDIKTLLENAIANLEYSGADYTAIYDALKEVEALDLPSYTDESVAKLMEVIDSIQYGLPKIRQSQVNAKAEEIVAATSYLERETAIKLANAKGDDTAKIDNENKIIYGYIPNGNDYSTYLRAINGSIKIEASENGYGTGTKIYVMNRRGTEVQDIYTMIVKGDIDGDIYSDATDRVVLDLYTNFEIELNDAQIKAADVNKDGVVDITDLTLLELAGVFLYDIEQ